MTAPLADIGATVIGLLGERNGITVTRHASGAWVDGVYQQGSTTAIPMDAISEPAQLDDLLQIPEEERHLEHRVFWTPSALQESDETLGTEADLIAWGGRSWRVVRAQDWTRMAGYAQTLAVRVGT